MGAGEALHEVDGIGQVELRRGGADIEREVAGAEHADRMNDEAATAIPLRELS